MPGLTLRASGTAPHGLSSLPVEIWNRIVSYLGPIDKRHLGSVCRTFNRHFWHPERVMWRVPLRDVEEGDLEWAQWVFLESQTREALKRRLALPDATSPSFLPGEPGAYSHLIRLEVEVFLGGTEGDASSGFDANTFVRDLCSYHRVAPNLRDVRIHVDVRARDLALLYRSGGLQEQEDWRMSRRTSLFKDGDASLCMTTVVFHQLSTATLSDGSLIAAQVSQLLACLPPKTVGLVTAPLTAAAAARVRRGGIVNEKVITAIVPELLYLSHIADDALKSLTSLVVRQATPWCSRSLLQLRFPRLCTVALPVARHLFDRFLETRREDTPSETVRLDMLAGATHKGIERFLLTQDMPFAWHLLYHVKQAGELRVDEETSLACWPHDFLGRSQEYGEVWPEEEAFELPQLRPYVGPGKRGVKASLKSHKRARKA